MRNTSVLAMKEGDMANIAEFANEKMAGRFMSMGVLPGSRVRLVRRAPFDGGCYLNVDGASIAVRTAEADCILLQPK